MKRKILALSAVLALMAGAAHAQNKTTFGVRAGVNFQNINGKDVNGEKLDDNKIKTGFNVGVNAEIPLAQDFFVQPGVLFTTKGTKIDNGSDTKVNISYIEVPINFLYKADLGDGKLLMGVGPYVAFGIGGKVKSKLGDHDIEFEKEAAGLANLYTVKRLDAGGNLLFGYEFNNKFSAQLNAQLGLVNIAPDVKGATSQKQKGHNTGFGVSVGYRF